MIEYNIYKSRWKAIRIIILTSIFVVPSILTLNSSNIQWLNWICIAFFGLGYPAGLFNLFDRRPQIIINEIGIFDRTIHPNFINWEIIQWAYIGSVRNQKFICLVIDEKFEPSKKNRKASKIAKEFSKQLGFQEFNLNVNFTNLKAEKMLQFILAMIAANNSDRKTIIGKMLPEANH